MKTATKLFALMVFFALCIPFRQSEHPLPVVESISSQCETPAAASSPNKNIFAPFKSRTASQQRMLVPYSLEAINRSTFPEFLPFFAPVITATKADAIFTDNGSPGATPGDVIEYTVVVSNTAGAGMDATGVTFTDIIDINTTLVPGSVNASPIGIADAYNAIGNVGINVPAANGLLTNDIDPNGDALTVTAVNTAGTQGNVTFNANGSFTFLPAAGFEGATTFTYTVSDGTVTDIVTVTITVDEVIWFVDNSAGVNGDGRLGTPFNSLPNFVSGAADDVDDVIFLYRNTATNYTGPLTLLDDQDLIGQGATSSIVTIAGIVVPPFSNALPATGGTNPVIAHTTTNLTLAQNNKLHGFNIANTGGTALTGNNFATLQVRDVSVSNTTGTAVDLNNGTLDVIFKTVSASNATIGIDVTNTTGSFQIPGTGTTDGSGGIISNITQRGVNFANTTTGTTITLKNMTFTNANTADAAGCTNTNNVPCFAAVYFNNVSAVSMDNTDIDGAEEQGINGNVVGSFTLANSIIQNCGNSTAEGCIRMVNLGGTSSITSCTLKKASEHIVYIENTGATVLTLSITNTLFEDTRSSAFGATGFQHITRNTANSDINIDNCDFNNIRTIGADLIGEDNSNIDVNIINCGVDPIGTNTGRAFEVALDDNAIATFDILNNTPVKSKEGNAINVTTFLNSNAQGRINGNTITMGGTGFSGSGVAINTTDNSDAIVEVKNNNVSAIGFDYGVSATVFQAGNGTLNTTIEGNTLSTTDPSNFAVIYTVSGSGLAGETHALCANVRSNVVTPVADAWYLEVHTGNTLNLPGTGATPLAVWQNNGNTPNAGPVTYTPSGGTLTIGGACTTPTNPLLDDNPITQRLKDNPDSTTPAIPENPDPKTTVTDALTNKKDRNNSEKSLLAGETVTINGTGAGFNLPAGESTTIKFRVTINSPLPLGTCQISNQGTVTASGGINLMTDDPSVGGASDPTVTPLAGMTLGNLIFSDVDKNGVFNGGDAGIDGVTLNLYQDNGSTPGVLDGTDALVTSTTTAGGGLYSFPNLCSGNYIVRIDPAEFMAGGQLLGLISSPTGPASDPDDNVDNDDNGQDAFGTSIASQAITLDYSGMNVEVNNTLDFGFKTPTTVTISDVTMAEGSGGGTTNFTFTVTRSDNTEAFDLIVNTSNGTALSPSDYMAITNGMVSFTAMGSMTAMVTVVVNADNLVESDETFTVTLSGAPAGVVITDATGLGTIQNDDAAVLSIAATTQAAEDATNGLFTISTTNQFDAPVTVNFTVTGTATSGTDYTSIGTSIVFPANTSSVTIPVSVLADMIVEANETVVVTLTSFTPANASITIAAGPNNQATVTITDNDQATITIMNVSMAEGDAGTTNFSFKVTLDKQVDAAVSVNYMTVDGTATQPSDYTSTSNTLTFPANSAAGTMLFIDVPVIGDLVFESNETFTVKLDGLAANGRNVILSGGGMMLSGTGTILNDDIPPVIINEIDVANSGVDNMEFIELYDGGAGNTSLTGLVVVFYNGANDQSYRAIDLDGFTTNASGYFIIGNPLVPGVDITFPVSTLQNGEDAVALYTANGTDFPNGTAVTTTNLIDAIVYDTNDPDDLGLLILLNAGQPQVNEDANGSAACHSLQRIPNGSGGVRNTNTYQALPPTPDAANGVPIVTIAVVPVSSLENGGPNMVYTVTRTGNTSCSLDVPYTISGTATNGNDYTNILSSVTIPAGMTSATITVDPSNDQVVELDETVIIILTDGAAYDLGMNSSATGTILNDDNAVISVNSVSNPESTTPFQFTVSISRRVNVAVTVEFSTFNGTATTGDNDYNAVVSQLVTFPAGSNADQIVNVVVNNDTKVEANEVFTVGIANLMNSGRAVTLGNSIGTGTIQNDDAATLTIDDVSKLEGISGTTTFTFTVTLSADVQGGVMVDYTTANNMATAGSDYVAIPTTTLNFTGTAGEMKTIMVTVNGDCLEEPDETFFVNLSNIVTTAAPGAVTFADNQGLGTILNDDATFVGGIIYVDVNAAGLNNGTSWTNAFTNLQDALRIACTCGTTPQIWVADGTYYPDQGVAQTNDARASTFQLCNGVALYGGFAGGETLLSQRDIFTNISTLSGDLMGDDGGVFVNNADNAYHVVTGSGTDMTARIDGFTITAGNADVSDANDNHKGAGMYNRNGSPCISNCTFSGNMASQDGGGMWNITSSPVITNCTFAGNQANFGGGIYFDLSFNATMTNCVISGNRVSSDGGGIHTTTPANGNLLTLINCTLSGNITGDFGGDEGGGISHNGQAIIILTNTIIWNNQDGSGLGTSDASISGGGARTITYSLIQGQNPGGTNKDGTNVANDPQFITPVNPATAPTTAGDLRLQITSPMIDMGSDAAVPADTKDVDDDGDTAEPTPDRDLNNRIVGGMVDLGAYEFPCAADAGNITNDLVDSESFTICEGDEPAVIFSADGEQTDAEYAYAFLLVNSGGTIVQYNTTGDFTFAGLVPSTYTIYGLSYATFNTPSSVTDYLATVTTIAEIQADDADNGGELCLDLTSTDGETNTVTINQAATVTLNETAPAVCRTKSIDLTQLGAAIGGSATSATWSVLEVDSDGQFLDTAPNPDVPNNQFGVADIFKPGAIDGARGYVTLVLTTNDPDGDGPCAAVSAQIRIRVLNVDCGQFPWNGN